MSLPGIFLVREKLKRVQPSVQFKAHFLLMSFFCASLAYLTPEKSFSQFHRERSRRKNVALLFSGQLRQVDGVSFRTINTSLLSRYNCDVYGTFGVGDNNNDNAAALKFEELYSPILLETYPDNPFVALQSIFPPPAVPYYHKDYAALATSNNKMNVAALYDGLNRSFNQLQRGLVLRKDQPYDWVVRLRTDAVITVMLDLSTLEQGYVYISDLKCVYAWRNMLRSEFFIMPGSRPDTFQLLTGLGSLYDLNVGGTKYGQPTSFVDELLFMRYAVDVLKLGNSLRVTDFFTVWKTRDGESTMASKGQTNIYFMPFHEAQVEFIRAPTTDRQWFESPPFFLNFSVPFRSKPPKEALYESTTSYGFGNMSIEDLRKGAQWM